MKDSKINKLCKWEKYLETLCNRAKSSPLDSYDDLAAGYYELLQHLEKCEKEINKISDQPTLPGFLGIEYHEAGLEWEGKCRVLIERTKYHAAEALLRATAKEINTLNKMKVIRATKWKR